MRGPGHAIHQPPGPVSARHAVQGSPARREWSRAVPSSKHLEQSRRSHSAADTHCHHDVPGATPFPLDQGMADHTRTGHAVGMPNRDGAAADVESFDGNGSEEHTSELQSIMRISYAVFCLKNKNIYTNIQYDE